MRRPSPLGRRAPFGQDARDLWLDAYIQHPGVAATVQSILMAFRQAENGDPSMQCDLFDDFIEPDCHLASLFEKRNEAVAGKPYTIQSGQQGDTEADLMAHVLRETFRYLPMPEVFQHLLTFNKYGYACVEIDWDIRIIDGREWIVPVWFTPVRARRFRIGTSFGWSVADGVGDLRLFADVSRPLGDELRPGKWIKILRDAAHPIALSALMRSCVWPALGKRYGWRDWMIYSDKYGKPLPIAKYKQESDDEAKNVAMEILENIGNDIGAAVPETIELDFKEPRNTDNSRTHGGLIEHANAEMSKRVNGSTLANDNKGSGGASYALGAVHDEVRWEFVQYDSCRVESAFNTQVFAAFRAYNGLSAPSPEMKIQIVRALDPKTRVQVANVYKNELGGRVSAAQMAQELGFREPTNTSDELPGVPAAVVQPKVSVAQS